MRLRHRGPHGDPEIHALVANPHPRVCGREGAPWQWRVKGRRRNERMTLLPVKGLGSLKAAEV